MKGPWVALIIILAVVVMGGLFVDDFPFRARSCQGTEWRRRFPSASKDDIRTFLRFFVDAFAIKRKHALRLRPDDELMSIYMAQNPSKLLPDSLEFETLAKLLAENHRLSFSALWHEKLTLGELFVQVVAQSKINSERP